MVQQPAYIPCQGEDCCGEDAESPNGGSSVSGASAKVEGNFGVTFEILQHPASNLFKLLLGQYDQVAILSLSIPRLTLSGYWSYKIYVWDFPEVAVTLGVNFGLTVDIGSLGITAGGIAEAIQTQNPVVVYKSLAWKAIDDNGLPHWPLKAQLTVYGGRAS